MYLNHTELTDNGRHVISEGMNDEGWFRQLEITDVALCFAKCNRYLYSMLQKRVGRQSGFVSTNINLVEKLLYDDEWKT